MFRPTLERLLFLTKPYQKYLVTGLLALMAGSAINLIFPQLIRGYLNTEDPQYIRSNVGLICIELVSLFAVQAGCFFIRSFSLGLLGQKVVSDVRSKLYGSIIRRNLEFFDAVRVGDLISRLTSDAAQLQEIVSIKLSVFLRYSIQVLGGVICMFLISPRLTLSILVLLPLLVGISMVLGKQLKRYSRLQQTELGQATTVAEETFSAPRIVKAFNQESFETNRFVAAMKSWLELGTSRTRISAFFTSFVSFLLNISIIIVLGYGVHLVDAGLLTLGDLIGFLLFGTVVAVSFAFVAGGYAEFMQAFGAAERIFELLDAASGGPPTTLRFTSPPSGALELKEVSFSYPSRPEQEVLSKVSFKISKGQRVALVGQSGAGKSTVVNLLLKYYRPESGTITFDGVNIEELSDWELRNHIGIVPQEPQLFGVSVAENLRYGKPDATNSELEQVCKEAHIWDFVRSLPLGLDTLVGERGVQVSAGQRQRIAIARALLKDPSLLILDEATSNLDSTNEYLIEQALNTLMAGRTTLVIAHRLATVKTADVVIVLERGQIVQSGTHESLSVVPGLYRELVNRQNISGIPILENNVASGASEIIFEDREKGIFR